MTPLTTKQPAVLIVTTQIWLQVTRLALRLVHYGCKVSALCPANSELRYYDRLHSYHRLHGGDPLRSLVLAIEKSGATYLVPGDDLAVRFLHDLCEQFPRYRALVERSIGPMEFFPTIRSRAGFLALAAKLGIETPATAVIEDLEGALAWSRDRGSPWLLKKDGTWAGSGVRIAGGPEGLALHYAELTALERPAHAPGQLSSCAAYEQISIQEYIEGVAANGMFACDKGRILGSVQARVIAAKGKTGPAMMIDLIQDERIDRAAELLASSLQLSGFFGLDFILETATGTPYLIELNPRCTQLGHVALADGSDLAGALWAEWSGQPIARSTSPANELGDSICFYPQALAYAPQSSFLAGARLDVCSEDLPIVDRLARGNPALFARTFQTTRKKLGTLKRSLLASSPPELFYFEARHASLNTQPPAKEVAIKETRPVYAPADTALSR